MQVVQSLSQVVHHQRLRVLVVRFRWQLVQARVAQLAQAVRARHHDRILAAREMGP